jgi:hypothetical protein
MSVLSKDLDGRRATFDTSVKGLAPLNQELTKHKLEPIQPISEEDWKKKGV